METGQQLNAESAQYFEKRSLKQGSVGWILLVGLGVSYTISGDFSGWNYGIAQGGWFGLAVAWLLMGVMYLCTVFGLAGLVASFFSIMYAGSRQMFALSRAGYLPRLLAVTGKRKTPVAALVAMSLAGIGLVLLLHDGQAILDAAVFGACVSYALMNLSHMVLRLRTPRMPRAYRTPGGAFTTCAAFVLSCVAVLSTFFVDAGAAIGALAFIAAGLAYYAFYARKHLVSNAPEEEFTLMQSAESQLR